MRLRLLLACFVALSLTMRAPRTSAEPAASPHVALRFNPLALVIGRTSGEVEVWATDHLSVVGTFPVDWLKAP